MHGGNARCTGVEQRAPDLQVDGTQWPRRCDPGAYSTGHKADDLTPKPAALGAKDNRGTTRRLPSESERETPRRSSVSGRPDEWNRGPGKQIERTYRTRERRVETRKPLYYGAEGPAGSPQRSGEGIDGRGERNLRQRSTIHGAPRLGGARGVGVARRALRPVPQEHLAADVGSASFAAPHHHPFTMATG